MERLAAAGVALGPGLTEREIARIEQEYAFTFPEDFADLLRRALPTGPYWPDWRNPGSAAIAYAFAWPLKGILFDVEQSEFWLPAWGERPRDLIEAFEIVRQRVAEAPKLIPIYSHRYLPARPAQRGNPVFSVYQTDVIYYGRDLDEYFNNEFRAAGAEHRITLPVRRIEFWSELVELE